MGRQYERKDPRMTITDSVARIQDASPEQRLAAAQLALAVEGCNAGNAADCAWLACRGVDYLAVVAPADRDLDTLVRQLLPKEDTQMRLEMEAAA